MGAAQLVLMLAESGRVVVLVVDWSGGVRHEDGVSEVCCFRRERGKACPAWPCSAAWPPGSARAGSAP